MHTNMRRFPEMARDHKGFTLLEVLVVVALIALLIAILLPSLAAARNQVRRITCESNLKQLHLAWTTYLDSFQGFFPAGTNMEFNYGGLQGEGSESFGSNSAKPVPKLLNKLMALPDVTRKGGDVFLCPSDTGTSFIGANAFRYYGTSYYPNPLLIGRNVYVPYGNPCQEGWSQLVGDPWAYPPRPGLLDNFNRSRIDNPTQLLLIGDYCWLDTWDETVPDQFPYWHGTKTIHNQSFMDGHGEFVRIRKGIHVDARYSIIPVKKIRERMLTCQQEIKCP